MWPVGRCKSKPLKHAYARPSKRLRPISTAAPPEYAKQQAAQANEGGTALPPAEITAADERQEQLRAIASDLLYWKGGLKVLRQAQLPKWRGYFKWQIEAKIEALQTEYAKLRAECAKPDRINDAAMDRCHQARHRSRLIKKQAGAASRLLPPA